MLKGITFDFWQTLFYDPSEPQRMRVRAAGMSEALAKLGYHRPPAQVLTAILAGGRHRGAHDQEREIPPLAQVRAVLTDLDVPPDATPGLLAAVATPYCEGGFAVPPVMFPDAPAILGRLAADYPLALICNTGTSPGVVLRNVLRRAGLLEFFTATVFSDEIGWRKPHPAAFAAATAALGITPEECVHVGDDPWTDGHGAKRSGLFAILLTGGQHAARPQPSAHDCEATMPDLRVDGLPDLPAAVAAIATAAGRRSSYPPR